MSSAKISQTLLEQKSKRIDGRCTTSGVLVLQFYKSCVIVPFLSCQLDVNVEKKTGEEVSTSMRYKLFQSNIKVDITS